LNRNYQLRFCQTRYKGLAQEDDGLEKSDPEEDGLEKNVLFDVIELTKGQLDEAERYRRL
jgi:hypothetical protein